MLRAPTLPLASTPVMPAPSHAAGPHAMERLEERTLLSATGWSGGEPTDYASVVYVDGAFAGTENGSIASPFNTLAEGFARVRSEIAAGRSTKLLVKPGVYRERGLTLSAGQNSVDRSQNSDLVTQNTWFRMDRWGTTGDVVIDGADDWSVGKGEGGPWTAVAGQSNVFSRTWTRNWGLWGGASGSANVTETAGQRREMVFVNYGDGQGWRRLEQVALETYDYTKPSDNGTPATWHGPGSWTYRGYAGLGALKAGSFGVTELSTDAADGTGVDDGRNDSYQAGMVYVPNPAYNPGADADELGLDDDPRLKKTFKEIYDATASRAPAAEANKLFLKLPEGVDINNVQILVTTREGTALQLEGKHNAVLANITVQHFTSRMFNGGQSAVAIGRTFYDWWLTSGNTLLDNVTIRENNSYGLQVTGHSGITIRSSLLDDNGATNLNLVYSHNVKIENTVLSDAAWRVMTLGKTQSFVPASLKSWKNVNLQLDNVRFTGIIDKGFYSDSALQNATFNDVTFVGVDGEGTGVVHEITPGPIVYNRARFEGLDAGFSNVQAQNITIDNSDFVNNRQAIVTVYKTRNDKDTVRFNQTSFPFGTSMLDHEQIPLNPDAFTLTNSRLSSNRVAARLINQHDQFSGEAGYLKEFRDEAVFANNRYFLTDHPYAFENDNDYSTFDQWIAATRETGASWDASLATPAPAVVRPTYNVGFTWKRSTDWKNDTRFIEDGNGQATWFQMISRSRLSGAGRASANPWYKAPLDYMNFRKFDAGVLKRYLKNDITAHWASAGEMVADYNWSSNYIGQGPGFTEWRNPTGKALSLKITGDLTLKWGSGWAPSADAAIVLVRKDGTYQELWGGSYAKPASLTNTVAVTGMDAVAVGPEDRILVGGYLTTGGGFQSTLNLVDNLTLEVMAIDNAGTPTPPAAPANVGAAPLSASAIRVTWSDLPNETGYDVQYKVGASGAWTNAAVNLPAGTTSWDITGLGAGTQHFVRVRGSNAAGAGAWSDGAASATTPVPDTPPAAPSGLAATASAGQIALDWADSGEGDLAGYNVFRATSAGGVYTKINAALLTASAYVDANLPAGSTFFYRVVAVDKAGQASPQSATVSATTPADTVAAPSQLAAQALSASQVRLTWRDNSANESGFRVWRSRDGVNWTLVSTLGVGATVFTDSGLSRNTTYVYRVSAFNASQQSYSASVQVRTLKR